MAKSLTAWIRNILSNASLYLYDSTSLYNSASQTYDGIVAGEDFSTDKNLTVWSNS